MDSDYCPDPDWCPAAPDPHGHRTDDTYFYRRADADAGPGCDTNADSIGWPADPQVADHVQVPAGASVPDELVDEHGELPSDER